ncbi:unnamed protein product [Thlaspi arvense]|uniref:Uncharacterized protein n=1 Tax=Thlaspi arvense TaxID=13288 RepID=A0AAU9TAT3_THLAR|nr:unnamed protein product [Thlaspi arvense]
MLKTITMEKISMKFAFVILLAVMAIVTNVEAKRLFTEEAPKFGLHHEASLKIVQPPTQTKKLDCKSDCIACLPFSPWGQPKCFCVC